MADLTRREKLRLEDALGMSGGYVLHFSDRTFAEFFQEAAGIHIYDGKYDRKSGSKAHRMRAFWDHESNELVAKVLLELIEECNLPQNSPLPAAQEDTLREIANRLTDAISVEIGNTLPQEEHCREATSAPIAFISYKWESESHQAWVRKLAADLRSQGVDAKLDQWEVRAGDSFTDYMQHNLSKAKVILFVITDESVRAAEAVGPEGGALKFEVQMMNARRIAEGTRIIGIYRSGDRPPNYLRDHRYIDFRKDHDYSHALSDLLDGIFDRGGPPPVAAQTGIAVEPPSRPIVSVKPSLLSDGGEVRFEVICRSKAPVTWLNRTLDGPRGSIYGGGSSWVFEQASPDTWRASWSEHVSPWAPSGEYSLSGVSVRNSAELTSEEAVPVSFSVANTRVSDRPVIEAVQLSAHRVAPGGSIKVAIRAKSQAPVGWLDKALDGPRGNLYGGGSSARFTEIEPHIWFIEWEESFSTWAPTGQYVLSMLRVRNEAQLQSEEWPPISFTLVAVP